MKREEIVEVMARVINPEAWRVMDGYLAETERKYRGQNVAWPVDQFRHKESMVRASDALTALEAAGYAVVHIAGQELAKHWDDFCDGDRRDIPDGFEDRMIDAGLVDFREVEASDLDNAFAHERGLEEGGMIYVLTKQGRAMIAAAEVEDE